MQITCIQCSSQFQVAEQDQAFYQRIGAPVPKYCPNCRYRNRLSHRNERGLYADTCDKCGQAIISLYSEQLNLPVYCQTCWWKDDWDPTDFGQEIDWGKSFFKQFQEVRKRTPRLALVNLNSENSAYTNMSADNKDAYLLFASENCENCSYGKLVQKCKDCFDCSFVYDSELCYECINVRNCYKSIYLQDSQDCRDCGYSVGLRNCNNVFLSRDLHNKEYYILNQPVPKEEYAQRVAEIKDAYAQWLTLREGRVVKYAELLNSPDCTGDSLTNCKRVLDSYDLTDSQDCRYCTDALNAKDSHDCSFFYYQPELCYQSLSMLETYNVHYSTFIFNCRDVEYGDQIHGSHDVFLSTGLRNKQFVILNKQYTEAEYHALRKRIIEQMIADGEYGDILPMQYSLFAYNDTVANEYFPLTVEQARQYKLRWNAEADKPKAFKLTAAEQAFYQQMGLPEPTEHPELRHRRRIAMRNPRKLWSRSCARCNAQLLSTYKVERPETVLCEQCYLQETY